ncbi:hypothetical protein pb186bvf_019593 [Paramecium bursaria]
MNLEDDNFIITFHSMVQEINSYYDKRRQRIEQKRRLKTQQLKFKMLADNSDSVSEIIQYNKKQLFKMCKEIQQSDEIQFIEQIQNLLRQVKFQQQLLRNVQKQVYVNLIDFYKRKPKVKRNTMHIYIAESILQKSQQQIPKTTNSQIIIPQFK